VFKNRLKFVYGISKCGTQTLTLILNTGRYNKYITKSHTHDYLTYASR